MNLRSIIRNCRVTRQEKQVVAAAKNWKRGYINYIDWVTAEELLIEALDKLERLEN